MSHLIEIHNLSWSYPGLEDQSIFDGFDFTLDQGDFTFLIGKSGSGKTTLVKFLLRQLIPPTKTIFYHKEDIARFTPSEVQAYRRKMGVIFQDYKLLDTMSVWDNVTYPLIIDNSDPLDRYEFIEDILKTVGLSEKKHLTCQTLSGGEKQRVSIARSLVSQPEFIIADEPTGNLDRDNSLIVADTMIDLHKRGHTILFITHDQQLISYITSKHEGCKKQVL
ncbi:MAG TPA: ATP-binding cassette domain-containing protein [Candidatus Absconditabacterales bacterium]|nr:ATP-binding cassette domain-containing protein [Candidatus Absconditabacterales bacterium]